jgi:hypothetical protein
MPYARKEVEGDLAMREDKIIFHNVDREVGNGRDRGDMSMFE